jgi:excisionase family DNA binding protein
MDKRVLTTGEVAKYCGVHFRTVIRWIEREHLKAFQLPGRGDNRVEIDDFIQFLEKNKMPIPEEFQDQDNRVLVVEDDSAMANAISRVLKRNGYETLIAPDGFFAGALLGIFSPHVVTLDLSMPTISGREVLGFIRDCEALQNTRVLVVSALPLSDLEDAVAAGADDLLQKPFENDILLEKIQKLRKKNKNGGRI